jgi:serine/threonine protein kinase
MNRNIEDRFQLISYIGEGGMGQVFKVMDRGNQRICALKVSNIPFEKSDRERLVRECSIWFELRHIGQVVEVYEILSTDFGEFVILMEYVEGGDLRTHISDRQFGIKDRLLALYDIACALFKCNQEMPGFAHLDIKPSNCLRTLHGLSKLSDFGLASNNVTNISNQGSTLKILNGHNSLIMKSKEGRFNVGTPLYMAPEQILGCCDSGARADVYSFGIMALELLGGKHPINTEDIHLIFQSHLKGIPKHNRIWPSEVPKRMVKALNSCLEIRPNNRPQIDELINVFRKSLFSSSIYEAFAGSDMKRWPDPVDDALRKARSLWSLGQQKTALSFILKTLEEDPFQAGCWVQAAKWKLEMTKGPLDDSCREEIVNWCLRASFLIPRSDEEQKQELLEMIMSITYDEHPCQVSVFRERLEKMSQEQKAWIETKEKHLVEMGGPNRSLCVRCGEVRDSLIQRCPKCGFFPKDMRDIYNTYLLRVSNVNPHKKLPYHKRIKLLRELGSNINATIKQIESPPDYDKALHEFETTLGKLLHAMALGAEYKEINKIWKDIYGTRAPDVKTVKEFVSHVAKKLSKKTDAQ